jgi:hypothetical protein
MVYARRKGQPDDSETQDTARCRACGNTLTVLFTSSYVLIRLSIPANPADAGAWLEERAGTVSLALSLLPFAGIAFLWFIGVVRDRLGLWVTLIFPAWVGAVSVYILVSDLRRASSTP